MFFYREVAAADPWASATVFTENFNQALDTTNNWVEGNYNGSVLVSGGVLSLPSYNASDSNGSFSSIRLKNTNFQHFTSSKAIRVQAKVYVNQIDNDNINWTSIRVKSTWNDQGNFLNSDGYKITFIKRSGINKIQFIGNSGREKSGGIYYDLATFQLNTWYHMRMDVFPTQTGDTIRIYMEQTIDSGNWILLGEYNINSASSEYVVPVDPPWDAYNKTQIFLYTRTSEYSGGYTIVLYDDFKTYLMTAPQTIPPA